MAIDRRSLLLGSLATGMTVRATAQTRPPATAESHWLTFSDPTALSEQMHRLVTRRK
jgi:hypothetical protein